MWNCNWGYPYGHGGGFFGHGIIGILISVLLVMVMFYLFFVLMRTFDTRDKGRKDRTDSLEILKTKFAKGEISEEEYRRMRAILIE